MKKCTLITLALIMLFVAGCANVSTARSSSFKGLPCEDNSQSIGLYATRTGLYFITFPLWTEGGRDVDVNETVADLATAAKGQGATKLYTVVSQEDSYCFPWIFWLKTARVSATAGR